MTFRRLALIAAFVACSAAQAGADTLYVAAPPPAAPGHPLRLGPDRKASQIGDLVAVQFNFSTAASRAYSSATAKAYNVNQSAGTGLFGLPLLRVGGAIAGQTSANASDAKTDASTFTSSMMAVVTGVLPSGALQVEGDQELLINGEKQKLHVVGYARPEDIDNFDTIPSTRLADVHATFTGNDTKDHKGVLRKILDVLF